MLWYKSWLETRWRFAIAMALVTYRFKNSAIIEPRVAIGGAEGDMGAFTDDRGGRRPAPGKGDVHVNRHCSRHV